jgi:hypothetical protein
LDGTFKVVRQPFIQLRSIHTFLANGDDLKQMPFFFILMSSRHATDYKAVFEYLKTHILVWNQRCRRWFWILNCLYRRSLRTASLTSTCKDMPSIGLGMYGGRFRVSIYRATTCRMLGCIAFASSFLDSLPSQPSISDWSSRSFRKKPTVTVCHSC